MHDGGPLKWLPTESQTAVWEMWLFMMIHRRHAFRMTSERINRFISETPILQSKIEHEHHFNVADEQVKMNTPENMSMSWRSRLIHSMDGEISSIEAKEKKTIKKNKASMWADGNGRVDSRILKSLTGQTTHRAWVAKTFNLIGPL